MGRSLPLRGKVRAAARMPSSLTPDNFPNVLSSAAKASHSPAPRQLLKHAFLRFRGRPFSARSFAQRHETISEFPCPRHRAISHLLQSVAFASSPPTSQTPSPSPPRFRGRPFPRRHTRITKSHPESSAGSAHVPTPPCHASHGMRCRFHWRPFPASRIPEPTPKRRMRQPTANFSNTVSVAPLRGQLFSAQTYAPRHGTPLKPPWPR